MTKLKTITTARQVAAFKRQPKINVNEGKPLENKTVVEHFLYRIILLQNQILSFKKVKNVIYPYFIIMK